MKSILGLYCVNNIKTLINAAMYKFILIIFFQTLLTSCKQESLNFNQEKAYPQNRTSTLIDSKSLILKKNELTENDFVWESLLDKKSSFFDKVKFAKIISNNLKQNLKRSEQSETFNIDELFEKYFEKIAVIYNSLKIKDFSNKTKFDKMSFFKMKFNHVGSNTFNDEMIFFAIAISLDNYIGKKDNLIINYIYKYLNNKTNLDRSYEDMLLDLLNIRINSLTGLAILKIEQLETITIKEELRESLFRPMRLLANELWPWSIFKQTDQEMFNKINELLKLILNEIDSLNMYQNFKILDPNITKILGSLTFKEKIIITHEIRVFLTLLSSFEHVVSSN